MKDKQHTPTPWVFNSRKEHLIGSNGETVSVWNAGLSFGPRDAVTEANAEFIVRACNSHDALIRACNDMLDWINIWDVAFSDDPEWLENLSEIKEVIQKAVVND